MTIEVLNRSKGLLNNISPTGTTYAIEMWPANPALYRIRSTNKNGPELLELAGMFTSVTRAQQILTKYLVAQWEMSDATATKLAKKSAA